MKKLLLLKLLTITTINAQNPNSNYSFYFFGIVEHFYPVAQTNEGNMKYLSVSKKSKYKNYEFENGIGSYIDSYRTNSYNIYTNIGKKDLKVGPLKPLLSIAIHSKGVNYSSKDRKIFLLPAIKLRIGDKKGLFFNIMPIPKIRPYTNGFVATEIGYSF